VQQIVNDPFNANNNMAKISMLPASKAIHCLPLKDRKILTLCGTEHTVDSIIASKHV
jgi:hypothetical protein